MDTTALVAQFLITLKLFTGYEVSAPEVHQMSREEIGAILCPVSHCKLYSAYAEGAVYLSHDVDMTTAKGRSTLFHELVHHGQAKGTRKGRSLPTTRRVCDDEWIAREHEAYAAQNRYLSEVENTGQRVYFSGRC